MSDAGRKVRKVLTGTAALAAAVKLEIDPEHGEIERVEILGAPIFRRTEEGGLPVVFGLRFPRWIRGPRRG